jgi:hypothetical protein
MKINVIAFISNYDGKPVLGENKKPVDLRTIFSFALNNQVQGETPQTAEQKNKIFQLSLKLYKDKEVDFTVDDLAFIKERVGKVWSPLIYGRVCEIIEKK